MKSECSGVDLILISLLGTNLFLTDFSYALKINLNILLTSQIYSLGHRHIWIPREGLRTARIRYRKYDDCSHTHFLVDTAHNAMKMWGKLHLDPYGLSRSNLRYLQMYYLKRIMWHDWHYNHFNYLKSVKTHIYITQYKISNKYVAANSCGLDMYRE